VATLALLGVVISTAALLGTNATGQLQQLSKVPPTTLLANLEGFVARRLDELAVLLEWDDGSVTYLDQTGRRRQLAVAALWQATRSADLHLAAIQTGPHINLTRADSLTSIADDLHGTRTQGLWLLTVSIPTGQERGSSWQYMRRVKYRRLEGAGEAEQ
jgi:hypothetical protein